MLSFRIMAGSNTKRTGQKLLLEERFPFPGQKCCAVISFGLFIRPEIVFHGA